MNLYQKIVEVRKVAEGFSKDGASYGYTYVTGNQVLGKIKDKMNELNLLLFPSTKMGEHHTHAYKTAKGKDVLDFVVKGEMSYTWINGDEPSEREVISWAYYGQQDDISKAYGSALTYSERYFLLKCLGLPTDEDDPDKPKENQEPNKQPVKTPEDSVKNFNINTPTPPQTQPTSQPTTSSSISAAQIKYAHTLKGKKKISDADFNRMLNEHGNDSLSSFTAQQARTFITFLQAIADPA